MRFDKFSAARIDGHLVKLFDVRPAAAAGRCRRWCGYVANARQPFFYLPALRSESRLPDSADSSFLFLKDPLVVDRHIRVDTHVPAVIVHVTGTAFFIVSRACDDTVG